MKKLIFWILSTLTILLFGCRSKPNITYHAMHELGGGWIFNSDSGFYEYYDSTGKKWQKGVFVWGAITKDSTTKAYPSYLIDDSTGVRVTDSGDRLYIDTVHWHSEVSPIVRKRTKPNLHYY